jgi:GntR family transcriptional regulator
MEFTNNQPIYLQIADYFCENIIAREWGEEQKIPSVREIAVLVEVNPNTAMRAYTFLQEKDIIYNKRGIGYFVSVNGYEKALAMRREEFFKKEVPQLFKTMMLLKVECADLEQKFREHVAATSKP